MTVLNETSRSKDEEMLDVDGHIGKDQLSNTNWYINIRLIGLQVYNL